MVDTIKITRNQLREIIGEDNDAIRNFEKVFIAVEDILRTGVVETVVAMEGKIYTLESQLNELTKRVSALEP